MTSLPKFVNISLTSIPYILVILVTVLGAPTGESGDTNCKDQWEDSGCSFPFYYDNVEYNNCTAKNNDGRLWCSTTLVYTGEWKNCTRQVCQGNSLYSIRVVDLPRSAQDQCAYRLTEGGNAGGAPCVFPFIYRGTTYTQCTSVNHNKNWCATTSNYDRNRLWGNCLGCSTKRCAQEFTSNGAACAFPFQYNGKWYDKCTTTNHPRPWCGFTALYQRHHGSAWGDCTQSCTPPVSCKERTEGGSGGGARCVFPFTYDGFKFYTCTVYKADQPWCSMTASYSGKWGYCRGCDQPVAASECGVRNIDSSARIVGGTQSEPYSWPWMVSIRTSYVPGYTSHKCGGTILNAFWILTAAHCVHNRLSYASWYVYAGTHYKYITDSETGVQVRGVKKIIEYPSFSGLGSAPDFALLLLDGALDFTDPKVGRVCLPSEDAIDGEDCYVTGWGSTQGVLPDDVLQEIKVPVLSSSLCGSAEFYGSLFQSFEFCAGFEDGGKDSCGGDSGGPYMCYRNQHYELIGTVSWGSGCALATKPGVYGRVKNVLTWISSNAGDVSKDYCEEHTAGGTAAGQSCYFPFEYKGKLYMECTTIDHRTKWCSTTLTWVGKWGNCIGCGAAPDNAGETSTPVPDPEDPTPPNQRIRIVEGANAHQGRVEVMYKNSWGTVCDDFWDTNAARVTCKMLGYDDGDVLSSADTPDGTTDILLDNIQCRLTDTILWNCPNTGWTVHDCKHSEDAGVKCYHPPGESIRLVGGTTSDEGRVEVMRNGNWGSVCDPAWDDDDAFIVCHTLGYNFGNASDSFGQGTGDILMGNVDCDRQNDQNLWRCAHDGWGAATCDHTQDVGVTCFDYQWDKNCGYRNPISLNALSESVLHDDTRIVGGVESTRFSWPWMVSVRLGESHYCAGSIISPDWIVSAAHCFDDGRPISGWKMIAGMHKKSYYETEASRQERTVAEIKLYPGFIYLGSAPDIALIKVNQPFDFISPEVSCISLPQDSVIAGENCYVTGWGATEGTARTDVLNEVVVPVVADDVCKQADWYGSRLSHYEFCAGFEEGQKDSCQGDSGGPVMVLRNQKFQLAGIVSWGDGCADAKRPGVYTRVYDTLEWIKQETGLDITI